jgi:hypothetical protein
MNVNNYNHSKAALSQQSYNKKLPLFDTYSGPPQNFHHELLYKTSVLGYKVFNY